MAYDWEAAREQGRRYKAGIAAGEALEAELRATCERYGLDLDMAAKRVVAERVLHHWHVGFGNAPIMAIGGIILPQSLRPTSALDIRSVRSYQQTPLEKPFHFGEALFDEGIVLRPLDKDSIGLTQAGGHPTTQFLARFEIGEIGKVVHRRGRPTGQMTLEVNVQQGIGIDAWPDARDVMRTEFRSFMPNGRPYIALAQPRETQIAEKWIAVIMQADTDLSANHLVDIAWYRDQTYDPAKVASELQRLCRHHKLSPRELERTPPAISYSELCRREAEFVREVDRRRLDMTVTEGMLDLTEAWHHLSAHIRTQRAEAIRSAFVAEQAERRRAMAIEIARENAAFSAPASYENNVIPFRR